MKIKYTIPLIIFVALSAPLFFSIYSDIRTKTNQKQLIGKNISNIQIPSLLPMRKDVSLEQFRGKYFLINIFASWCAPCRLEHQNVMKIKNLNTLPILGIAINDHKENARRWLKELGNPYELVGFDKNGQAALDLGITKIPETYLIDPNGNIKFKHSGPITEDIYNQRIKPLLYR